MLKQSGFVNFSLLLIMLMITITMVNWAYQQKQLSVSVNHYLAGIKKRALDVKRYGVFYGNNELHS